MRRFLGVVFALLGLGALGFDLWVGPGSDAPFRSQHIAEIWAQLHRPSLIGLNSSTEQNFGPELWDAVLLPAVSQPAAPVFLGLAILFLLLARIGGKPRRKDMMFTKK